MLQTRSGKRAGAAAVNIALDMLDDGFVDKDQAIMMIKPEHLKQLLHPQFSDVTSNSYISSVIAKGLPASPGAAVGNQPTPTYFVFFPFRILGLCLEFIISAYY